MGHMEQEGTGRGKILRDARRLVYPSQEALADILGTARNTVGLYERDQAEPPVSYLLALEYLTGARGLLEPYGHERPPGPANQATIDEVARRCRQLAQFVTSELTRIVEGH